MEVRCVTFFRLWPAFPLRCSGGNGLDYSDLTPVEVPVKIGGKRYILREASGDAAVRYHNANLKVYRYNDAGKLIGMEGTADTEPDWSPGASMRSMRRASCNSPKMANPIP